MDKAGIMGLTPPFRSATALMIRGRGRVGTTCLVPDKASAVLPPRRQPTRIMVTCDGATCIMHKSIAFETSRRGRGLLEVYA